MIRFKPKPTDSQRLENLEKSLAKLRQAPPAPPPSPRPADPPKAPGLVAYELWKSKRGKM